MKKVWISLVLIFLLFEIQAQKKINALETFGEGYENLLSNDYPEALFSFEQLVKNGYENSNISYLSGICYLNIPGQEKKAISSFEEAIKKISENYAEGSFSETSAPLQSYYYLAQSYRISGDYLKAREMLLTLQDRIDTAKDKSTFSLIKHELAYGNNADALMKLPIRTEIKNAGNSINSPIDELNPAITPDESTLFFVAKKKFYDAIYQNRKVNDEWNEKEEITNRLGSDGEFRVLSVSMDGTKMLLYSYDMYSSGNIYESKFAGNKWSKCKKLNKNINSSYSENFASYSPDGKTLYFTSNRPGGQGGYDIYKSNMGTDGEWSEAINLGSVINTEFDEATPSVSPDGNYLFFSSKGHYSMGGFDIFRSKIVKDKFQYPRNMGYPLNSPGDNLDWVSVGDGLTGYIPALLPNGLGGFDIWKIHVDELPNLPRFVITGSAKSNDNASAGSVQFTICLDNLETKTVEYFYQSKSGNSSFEFKRPAGQYQLDVNAEGHKGLTKDIVLDPEQLESEIHFDLVLEKNIVPVQKRSFDLHSIFFSFDSWNLSKKYFGLLDSVANLLSEFPSLQLEITGFTDGIGKPKYNQHLSLLRSESVMHYLVSKNIDKSRLHCQGKGSSNHIAIERTKNGRDLATGRLWNRRVELRISPTDLIIINNIVPPVPPRLRIDK
jgi:outer membrane protein OmpA-like peptidoglycan-associated protein